MRKVKALIDKIIMGEEFLVEIVISLRQHKLRSMLTGFGIAWGMFILILLLGAGNGFRHGMLNLFSDYASNSMWITGYKTDEINIGGLQKGQKVEFTDEMIHKLKKQKSFIDLISPEISFNSNNRVAYNDNSGVFNIKGIGQSYMTIKNIEIEEGRNLNVLDYKQARRNVIIGSRVKEILFGNSNPIGKSIYILNTSFKVTGIIKEGSILSLGETNSIYIPDVVIYNSFNIEKKYTTFGILLKPDAPVEKVEKEIREFLSGELNISKTDRKAIEINNIQLQVSAFNQLFNGIDIFLWGMGICILLCGVIGIANIMLVNVKDKTHEIGIRKAIGATPQSIILSVITESSIITLSFGLIGILLGYAGLSIYNYIVSAIQSSDQTIFDRASVDSSYIILSLFILILSGIFAGVYPAQKAANIKPIETINQFI
jgi:putative ABC transport system permease protein